MVSLDTCGRVGIRVVGCDTCRDLDIGGWLIYWLYVYVYRVFVHCWRVDIQVVGWNTGCMLGYRCWVVIRMVGWYMCCVLD